MNVQLVDFIKKIYRWFRPKDKVRWIVQRNGRDIGSIELPISFTNDQVQNEILSNDFFQLPLVGQKFTKVTFYEYKINFVIDVKKREPAIQKEYICTICGQKFYTYPSHVTLPYKESLEGDDKDGMIRPANLCTRCCVRS